MGHIEKTFSELNSVRHSSSLPARPLMIFFPKPMITPRCPVRPERYVLNLTFQFPRSVGPTQ